MGYWRLFWGNLNTGYKRLHLVLGVVVQVILFLVLGWDKFRGRWRFDFDGDDFVGLIFLSILLIIIYMVVVSSIMWVKEGMKE
tara:strand:+ start:700 stop:948 length:249 start_codon:yes stop_codon:yes gene_type:complete